MALEIKKEEKPKPFILNRTLHVTADGRAVEEDDADGVMVLGGAGSTVSAEDVEKYGLDDSYRQLAEGEVSVTDLETKTVAELKELAAEKGVAASGLRKAEIVGALKEAQAIEAGELDGLTVAKLKEVAEKEGIDLAGVSLKADIIKAIEDRRAESAE